MELKCQVLSSSGSVQQCTEAVAGQYARFRHSWGRVNVYSRQMADGMTRGDDSYFWIQGKGLILGLIEECIYQKKSSDSV